MKVAARPGVKMSDVQLTVDSLPAEMLRLILGHLGLADRKTAVLVRHPSPVLQIHRQIDLRSAIHNQTSMGPYRSCAEI